MDNAVREKLEARDTPYENILAAVKTVCQSFGLKERGGAVGFYDADFDRRGEHEEEYKLCLRFFPLSVDRVIEKDSGEGVLFEELNLHKHLTYKRPYEHLFHPNNLSAESSFDEVHCRAKTHEHLIFKLEEERSQAWIKEQIQCPMNNSFDIFSHIIDNKDCECKERVAGCLDRNNGRSDRFSLLNDLDYAFMEEKKSEKWIAIPLPFLSSPAAIIIFPLRKSEGEKEGLQHAINIIDQSKPFVQTYVFNRIIQEIKEEEGRLESIRSQDHLAFSFLKTVTKILLPKKISWSKNAKEKYTIKLSRDQEWPHTSDKKLEIDMCESGTCEVELPTFFLPNRESPMDIDSGRIISESDTFDKEMEGIQNLMESTFDMLLTSWHDVQMQQTRILADEYQRIESDLETLIEQISTSAQYARRIEEKVSTSKEGFLKVSNNLNLFPAEQRTIAYRYQNKPDGNIEEFETRRGIYTEEEKEEKGDYIYGKLKLVHELDKADDWNAYAEFLDVYGGFLNIGLLKCFDTTEDDDYAHKQFLLLKMLLHRSQSGGRLYSMQLMFACLVAMDERDEIELIVKNGSDDSDGGCEQQQLSGLEGSVSKVCREASDFFADWLSQDLAHALDIEDVRPARVLGTLIRLLSTELVENKGVYPTELCLISESNYIELLVHCQGAFDDEALSKLKNMDMSETSRGLRSALKTLCQSTGSERPAVFERTAEQDHMRDSLERSNNRVFVGSSDEESVFLIRWDDGQIQGEEQSEESDFFG